MQKNLSGAPFIAGLITFLLLSGVFFLVFSSKTDFRATNALAHFEQTQSMISAHQKEISALKDSIDNPDLNKEDSEYQITIEKIKIFEEQVQIMEGEKERFRQELKIADEKRKKKSLAFLLSGIAVIILVSLAVGFIVFLLVKFNVFQNGALKKYIYLIGFWILFLITIVSLLEKQETQGICFAILSTGFLIAHNISKGSRPKE